MNEILAIASRFKLDGEPGSCESYGSGHIHDTYLVQSLSGNTEFKYILQKINTYVFRQPDVIMANIIRISEHFNQPGGSSGQSIIPKLILTTGGDACYRGDDGSYWRCYVFVPDTISYDRVEDPAIAREAARCFGRFSFSLKDLPAGEIGITIPDFHNLEYRYEEFSGALETAGQLRLKQASQEIKAVERYRDFTGIFHKLSEEKNLPVRICHMDTKLNNVLIDKDSGKGICVIDLDTVMPGSVLSDFGDMVRTFTNKSDEDQPDLSEVYCRTDIYRALAWGYLSETLPMLEQVEADHLLFGAKFIILMQAVRFLTDYLKNDVYYKTGYNEHNLVRTRNQLKLLSSIEQQETDLENSTRHIIEELKRN